MDWSLVGLWIIQLFAVKEQIQVERPPEGSSVSLSLTIIQNAMQMWNEGADSHRTLSIPLSDAVKDNYERRSRKESRYLPNKKDKPSATRPKLVKATNETKINLQNAYTITMKVLNGVALTWLGSWRNA